MPQDTSKDSVQKPHGAMPPMKRVRKSLGRNIEALELDVTSVMNLFMVIVPFLLSMAVFTQVSVIEFSLPPAQSDTGNGQETKDLDISIVISMPSGTSPGGFRIVGTGKILELVPLDRGKFQFDILKAVLKEVKFQYPSQKGVVLVIDGNVLYDDIIQFMDICRESQFPEIGLSGEIG
jgi:biopolymer transport protein ExbD